MTTNSMRHLFFILSLFFSCTIWGQGNALPAELTAQIDSVEKALERLEGKERLSVLFSLAQFTEYHPSQQKKYIRRLEEEAERQNDPKMLFDVARLWGSNYYELGFLDSTLMMDQKAEMIAREHQMYDGLFLTGESLAKLFTDLGQFDEAQEKARAVYDEAKETGHYTGMARALSALAFTYNYMNRDEEAEKFFKETISVGRMAAVPDTVVLIQAMTDLAGAYLNQRKYEQTLAYADTMRMMLGSIPAQWQTNYAFEADYFSGCAYSDLKQFDEALHYIRQAEALLSTEPSPHYTLMLNQLYAKYYIGKEDFDKVLEYKLLIAHHYESKGWKEDLASILEDVGLCYTLLNRHKEAAETYAESLRLTNELKEEDFYKNINELRTVYELDKQELLTQQERERVRSARIIIVALAVILLLIVAISVMALLNARRAHEKNRLLFRQLAEKDHLLQLEIVRPLDTDKQTTLQESQAADSLFDRLDRLMQEKQVYTQPDISRKAVATELSTNENYLHNAIKEKLNLSFSGYISLLRLEHGRKLLLHTAADSSIEDIGEACGFGSRTTFYRLFRERYGMSPSEFRRIAAEERANG
ncbi:helix-turn-helix domain-containing protein [Parabacteroides sp. OttesenSCG-928-J18]|nr:helix-turn-helix domain-containing protein [Parabacteroides sp. OttesenSCG-928-J18]